MSLGVGCEPQILGSLESAAGGGGIVGSTGGAIGRGGAGVVPLGGANTSIAGGAGTGGILGDSRRKSLAGYSGTGVAFGGCRGGVTRGARDALGSFREACGALGASGDTWPSPKDSEEGSGEGFEGGTR